MISAWLSLIKFRLGLTVTLTSFAGYIISSGYIDSGAFISAAGVFLLAGAAGAINQVQEHRTDLLMDRTCRRPIPTGRITPLAALTVSALMILSGSLLLRSLYQLPATLGLLTIILYNLVYTPLKKVNYLAVLPGALVGALPPLIGWTAAGGRLNDPAILFLFMLLFLWQVPHFWMLVIKYHNEYQKAGIASVMSVVNEGQVRRIIFVWLTVLSLFSSTWFVFGIDLPTAFVFTIPLFALGFIIAFHYLLFRAGNNTIRPFILSNIYITLLFLVIAAGSLL